MPEVDRGEFEATVAEAKLLAVQRLIDALSTSPESVDGWIEATSAAFPVIQDRGWAIYDERERNTSRTKPLVVRLPEPRLPQRARAAYEAREEGSALALGEILELRDDLDGAEEIYRRAGETGDPQAFYALGRVLLAKGEEFAAAECWQSAADCGIAEAGYRLAMLESVEDGRADRYLRQAAAAGHVPACYAVGCHAFANEEYDQAAAWWLAAAKAGYPAAIEALQNLRMDRFG